MSYAHAGHFEGEGWCSPGRVSQLRSYRKARGRMVVCRLFLALRCKR